MLAGQPAHGNVVVPNNRLLSFNRTQSMVVTSLLTGHNTLRRCHYIILLIDSPLWKRFGAEEETSAHVLCKCEVLASLRHTYWVPFSWTQRISLEAIWNFTKETRFP
jgi:hypothetical protein